MSAPVKHLLKYPALIAENIGIIMRFLFGAFCIALACWFFVHQRQEFHDVRAAVLNADAAWILAGAVLVLLYVAAQGWMYMCAFAAAGARVSLGVCTLLFLKRNLISIFLPAGGISALAFFSEPVRRQGASAAQINLASTIYGFVGILTVVLVAIPAFLYAAFVSPVSRAAWGGLLLIVIIVVALLALYLVLRRRGGAYSRLVGRFPALQQLVDQLVTGELQRRPLLGTVAVSTAIECIGIAHLSMAMLALHAQPSLFAAVTAYVISVIFMIISPFLRGMGAVELSMAFLLTRFGMLQNEAISTTLLYRLFEFWLPLVLGVLAFLRPANRLFMRVTPAALLILLGLVNILSVLTPAIASRLQTMESVIPISLITASNYFVFTAGLVLLVVAAFLLKGLRNAWYFAVFLSVSSCVGHLTKALDYEEALLSALVAALLIATRKDYNLRTSQRLGFAGVKVSLATIGLALIYGIAGFYFLDQSHFGIDFSLHEALVSTFRNFFLLETGLVPHDRFASAFLHSIRLLGFGTLAFLLYSLARPYARFLDENEQDLAEARVLLQKTGNSSLDYFKTSADKLIFFSGDRTAFLAYRLAGKFAVVLETPVSHDDSGKKRCIRAFDRYCYRSGLKSIYYRVPQRDLHLFTRKKHVFLGQEGVVDLPGFTLEGAARKSIRNAISKMKSAGFQSRVYQPPIPEHLLSRIAVVSVQWLQMTGRTEIIFSQGAFDADELRGQTIITAESSQGEVVGFLNIIPDYAPGEGTYDLIRKVPAAPGGTIDFLMVALFEYLRSSGYLTVNLGLAPMSGLEAPVSLPDKSIKFAYDRIRSFAHYKGLREFKDKFSPVWHNQYLVFDEDYDLIGVPRALSRVIKP